MGAAGFSEQAAGGALAEVVFGEGLAGNELQAEAIDEGAHGFEQVASERVSAEAELVVVANGRVQPGAVQRQGDFGAGKGVAEGEQGVERVARGAAVAVFEAQAFGHDGAQAREVGAGGCAFYAAQAGQAAGLVDCFCCLRIMAKKGHRRFDAYQQENHKKTQGWLSGGARDFTAYYLPSPVLWSGKAVFAYRRKYKDRPL